jgi:hypothetical protein
MDTVLLIIGVLGLGAVVIAAYVFVVAARNYVSENDHPPQKDPALSTTKSFIDRNLRDRREILRFDFPMTVNGMLIPVERRIMPDRRFAAA